MSDQPPRERRRRSGGGDRARGGRARDDEDSDRARELAAPLARVLKRLPEIERRVVEYRMGLVDGHPRNLADTARELNLSQHETKQIEQRAFARIREVVPLRQLQRFLS